VLPALEVVCAGQGVQVAALGLVKKVLAGHSRHSEAAACGARAPGSQVPGWLLPA
jgi:hypothetical protein